MRHATGGPDNGPWWECVLREEDRPPGQSGDLDAERSEIGQVNTNFDPRRQTQIGFFFEVGKTYVIRTHHRFQDIRDFGTTSEDDRRNVLQLKHTDNGDQEPISPAPPLSLKQFEGGVGMNQRWSTANGIYVWEYEPRWDEWEYFTWVVRFAFDGMIDFYVNGKLDHHYEGPTIKQARGTRNPMPSTMRRGIYQGKGTPAHPLHVGPTRVELLG